MSLTLILMRHAKSSWGDLSLDDFDRPLNGRGRRSALTMAEWLAAKGYVPQKVLVSGARRTVETWEVMADMMSTTAIIESSPALYNAGPDIIMKVLKSQSVDTVMIICHNPGIAEFAERIIARPSDHPEFSRHPTAATSLVSFDINKWADITWNSGKLLEFAVPRDLTS